MAEERRSGCCRAPASCPAAPRAAHRLTCGRRGRRRLPPGGRGRHDGAVPTAVRPLAASPTSPIWWRSAGRQGLDAVGVAPADPFAPPAATSSERKAAGLHGGMAFTYRNPDRSSDPGPSLPVRPGLVVGARSYRREDRRRRRPARTARRPGGRYAWDDHYGPLRDALWAVAGASRRRRLAGPGAGRRQRPGRPGGGLPGRARLVRQERQPAAARARGAGSCWARWSPTRRWRRRRAGSTTGAAPAPAASTAARPARSWPRGGRRPPLPGLAAAGRGAVPAASTGWPWATASTAATTARRCARPTGGVDRTARRTRPPGPRRRTVDLLDLLGRRRRAARPARAVVHPPPRPALPAAQRPGGAGQRGRRRPTRGWRRRCGGRWPTRPGLVRAHAVWAAGAWAGTTCWPRGPLGRRSRSRWCAELARPVERR